MSWSRKNRSARVVVTLVCVLWGLSGCATTYEQGESALESGEIRQAETLAKRELRANPEDPRANLLLAKALTKRDPPNWRKAEPYAKLAFDSGQIDGEAGRLLGKIYWEVGQPIETVAAWTRARADDPTSVRDSDFLYALRTALTTSMTFKNFEEALTLRQELKVFAEAKPEVVAASPNPADIAEAIKPEKFTTTRESFAASMAAEGRYEEAAALYAELTTENPDDAPRYARERGELMLKLGRADEATAALKQYIEDAEGPERERRLRDSAIKAQADGARGVSITFYEMLLQDSGPAATPQRTQDILELVKIYLSLDELDSARRYIDLYIVQFKELDPSNARLANAFGNVEKEARRQGKIDLAVELLERAILEAEPNFALTQSLANQYARSALSGEVERVLKTYVDRQGSTRESLEQAGQWARQRRDFELAQFFMNKIVVMPGASAADWYALAQVYSALARVEDLRDAIKQYLKLRKRDRQSLIDSAEIFSSQRLFEDAEKLLKEAYKNSLDDITLVESFERLYFQWGKPDAVHAIYKQWIKANGSDPDIIAEVGRRFLSNGRHRDALPYYERAAKAGEVMAYRQIAEIHLRQRRDLDMKKALDSYVEASSNKVSALNDALSLYNRSQLVEERVRVLEELVELQPRNRGYNNQLGQQYIEQGRTADAFELWRAFLRGSSDPYNELERLARDFSQQGRQEWILMFYEDMIAQDGHDKRIYRLIGNTLARLASDRINGMNAGRITDGLDPAALQERATHFYELYLTEVSLDVRELSDYASDLRQKFQWELAAKAYAMVIERSRRPERHIILNYGITLLHTGDMERGEEMLHKYYVDLGSQPHHAATIVDHLVAHRRYIAAEPYLKEMLGSRQRNHVQTAFQKLSEIYRRTDRRQEFLALMETFMSNSSDPRTAREEILREARNSGMWKLEAEQLEILNESSSAGQQHVPLAIALLKSGEVERARDTLREYATMANGNEGILWLDVAAAYQNRGMFDDARAAIDSSIAANPDNHRPYILRANHLLSQGLHDQATQDFETAIIKAQQDVERASVYMQMIEGYRAVGRHDLASSALRDALKLKRVDRPTMLVMQANAELGDGDHVKARRLLKTLRRDGVPLERVIQLARNHGYLEEAAEMIEEELTSGDYVSASALATLHMDVFTTLGGFERLELVLQPIFDRPRTDRTVERMLGAHLLNVGHLERGALYLRSAWDAGERDVTTLLASAYVRMGAFSDASDLYMSELERTPQIHRAHTLSLIATDYLIAGEEVELRRLLQHLSRDPRHASAAIPLLAADMARAGGVLAAMSLLRDVANPKREELAKTSRLFASNLGDQNAHEAFFLGVIELARAGFPAEARALVLEADPKLQSTVRARKLLARLGAHVGDLGETDAVGALLNPSAQSTREIVEKLSHARLLLSLDQHAPARAAALEHLDSSDNARSYNALDVLVRSARITRDTELIDGWLTRFIDASGDRLSARGAAAELLYNVGLDERALALALETARMTPTDTAVENGLRYAQAAGDVDAVRELSSLMWRVHNHPDTTAAQFLNTWKGHQPLAMSTPLLDRYSAGRIGYSQNVLMRARTLLIAGEVQPARDLMLEHLDRTNWDPIEVDNVTQNLYQMGLQTELARTIAPRLDPTRTRSWTALYVGQALAYVGDDAAAREWLDLFVSRRGDASEAASLIASTLSREGHASLALVYGELAVERAPSRPHAYYHRGLARIVSGDIEGARADLARGVASGIRLNTHAHGYAHIIAASLAAEHGHDELALELAEVASSSPAASESVVDPATNSIGALIVAKRPDLGLRLLESRFPSLATASTPLTSAFAPTLSGLYEDDDRHEQAFQVYRDALRWQLLHEGSARDPMRSITTLSNNLSYTFSTTNENVDEGERLVLKAIALSGARQSEFIDTLGWIYFRQGRLEEAEAEISRSLRTSRVTGSSHLELYQHLAEIKQARGDSEAAAWIHAFVTTMQ